MIKKTKRGRSLEKAFLARGADTSNKGRDNSNAYPFASPSPIKKKKEARRAGCLSEKSEKSWIKDFFSKAVPFRYFRKSSEPLFVLRGTQRSTPLRLRAYCEIQLGTRYE